MIINARSPYFITVNESGQVGSKVELFIYNYPNGIPSTPTYTLAKPIASPTQLRNDYNISSFVREFIENVTPYSTTDTMYSKVRVKRYKETSLGSYTLLDTIDYIGVNGWTKYTDGFNFNNGSSKFAILVDETIKHYYTRSFLDWFNGIFNITLGDKVEAIYKDLAGNNSVTDIIVATTDASGYYFKDIPYSKSLTAYNNGNTVTVRCYTQGTLTMTTTITSIPICEAKYIPYGCSFINRFGGWQMTYFFKASSKSMSQTSTSYSQLHSIVDYNPYNPQYNSFNINGRENLKVNTGFVEEKYSEIIKDLLLSETVNIAGYSADVVTTSTDLKTAIKDKNINYEIEFQFSFNIINDLI